jgi:hypothetical protein
LEVHTCFGELSKEDIALAQPVVRLGEVLVDTECGLAVTTSLLVLRELEVGNGPVRVVGWLLVIDF